MAMKARDLKRGALVLALLALAACGKANDEAATAADATDAPAEAAAAAPTQAPTTPADAALTVADLDVYVRGMQRELALLEDASAKVRAARAKDDTAAQSAAMMEMLGIDTNGEGATAAGIDQARYEAIKNSIDTVLGAAEMQKNLAGIGGDLSALSPEQRAAAEANRAEMQSQVGDPYASLVPEVAQALKSRQAELSALHARWIGLTMSAAG
jgi:hypothetical protein